MIKRFRLGNARGDTIVEVLIVLAVLSLAFSISYATANRGLAQSRNSEEHSEALGNVNTQVELVRIAVQKELPGLNQYTNCTSATCKSFCITSTTVTDAAIYGPIDAADTTPSSLTTTGNGAYPPACVQGGLYYQSVKYDPAHSDYVFTTQWEGIGSLGRQSEQIAYRVKPLQNTQFSGITLASSPAQIKVVVQKIPAANNNTATPSCSAAATQKLPSEINVILKQTAGADTHVMSTTDSVALFSTGLQNNTNYNATITAPSHFQICQNGNPVAAPTATSAPVQARPSTTTNILDLSLRPVCGTTPQTVNDGYYADPAGTYGDYLGTGSDAYGSYGDTFFTYSAPWQHTGPDSYYDPYDIQFNPNYIYYYNFFPGSGNSGVVRFEKDGTNNGQGSYYYYIYRSELSATNYKSGYSSYYSQQPSVTNTNAYNWYAQWGNHSTYFFERWRYAGSGVPPSYYTVSFGPNRSRVTQAYAHYGRPYLHYGAPYQHSHVIQVATCDPSLLTD